MHRWALSIRILLCHSLSVSDRRVTTQSISLSLTERSHVSVEILLRTLSPRWSPRDFPPQRRRRRRMPTPPPPQQQQQLRRWRRARAAMVFPACTRTSARWFLQCCAAWYVNAHLIPAISTEPHMHWHGVCRPKQHPITVSDRTPRCCGWNSSPSQCCASRSVHAHHISAIDILYSHRHHHYNSCHYLQHTIMTIITIHQKNDNNVQ